MILSAQKVVIQKDCIIVNIRDFNKIIIFNNYLLLLQFNIITAVRGISYILTVNYTDFFYQ